MAATPEGTVHPAMPEPYGEESLAQDQGSDFQYGAPCYDPPPPAGSPEYAGEVPGHPAFTAAARQHDADARQHANAGPAGRGPVGPEEDPSSSGSRCDPSEATTPPRSRPVATSTEVAGGYVHATGGL